MPGETRLDARKLVYALDDAKGAKVLPESSKKIAKDLEIKLVAYKDPDSGQISDLYIDRNKNGVIDEGDSSIGFLKEEISKIDIHLSTLKIGALDLGERQKKFFDYKFVTKPENPNVLDQLEFDTNPDGKLGNGEIIYVLNPPDKSSDELFVWGEKLEIPASKLKDFKKSILTPNTYAITIKGDLSSSFEGLKELPDQIEMLTVKGKVKGNQIKIPKGPKFVDLSNADIRGRITLDLEGVKVLNLEANSITDIDFVNSKLDTSEKKEALVIRLARNLAFLDLTQEAANESGSEVSIVGFENEAQKVNAVIELGSEADNSIDIMNDDLREFKFRLQQLLNCSGDEFKFQSDSLKERLFESGFNVAKLLTAHRKLRILTINELNDEGSIHSDSLKKFNAYKKDWHRRSAVIAGLRKGIKGVEDQLKKVLDSIHLKK